MHKFAAKLLLYNYEDRKSKGFVVLIANALLA